VQVTVAEHHRLRRAQRGEVQAGVEGFQVLPPAAESADGGEQGPGLGGADHDAAVDALGDGGGGPLDAVDGVGGQVALLDGVAERVIEHRPLAPLGRPGGRLAGEVADAGGHR
jgi:hypothetical protein